MSVDISVMISSSGPYLSGSGWWVDLRAQQPSVQSTAAVPVLMQRYIPDVARSIPKHCNPPIKESRLARRSAGFLADVKRRRKEVG